MEQKNLVGVKTQTPRATNWIPGRSNVNVITNGFSFGIVTTEYWGDFKKRETPLIEISIGNNLYSLPLDVFIKKVEPILKKQKGDGQ